MVVRCGHVSDIIRGIGSSLQILVRVRYCYAWNLLNLQVLLLTLQIFRIYIAVNKFESI